MLFGRGASPLFPPGHGIGKGVPATPSQGASARTWPGRGIGRGVVILARGPANPPTMPAKLVGVGIASLYGATNLPTFASVRPGKAIGCGVVALATAYSPILPSAGQLLIRRGEFPPNPAALPEGFPVECGIPTPTGTMVELLYLGGHDGLNKLVGGGFQATNGMPRFKPPIDPTTGQYLGGVALYDPTAKLLWISNADGTWTSK